MMKTPQRRTALEESTQDLDEIAGWLHEAERLLAETALHAELSELMCAIRNAAGRAAEDMSAMYEELSETPDYEGN